MSGAPEPLPAADLDALRHVGIPTVDNAIYRSAIEDQGSRRCQLAKLLVDDGWLPQAWEQRRSAIRAGVDSAAA